MKDIQLPLSINLPRFLEIVLMNFEKEEKVKNGKIK
jgi:hypothetical protein